MENVGEINLDNVKMSLEKNDFEVFVAQNTSDAKAIIMDKILPETEAKQISYGDSMTVRTVGIFDVIKAKPDLKFIEVSN